jgi:hypothetical protein
MSLLIVRLTATSQFQWQMEPSAALRISIEASIFQSVRPILAVGSVEQSAFYECPITISPVSNTTTDAQTISDSIARLAASAIGLQGRSALADGNEFWTQFQFYPYG